MNERITLAQIEPYFKYGHGLLTLEYDCAGKTILARHRDIEDAKWLFAIGGVTPMLKPFTTENIEALNIKLAHYGNYSLSSVADFLSSNPSKILEVREALPEELRNLLISLDFDMEGLIEKGLANDLDKYLADIEAVEHARCRANWKEFIRKTAV